MTIRDDRGVERKVLKQPSDLGGSTVDTAKLSLRIVFAVVIGGVVSAMSCPFSMGLFEHMLGDSGLWLGLAVSFLIGFAAIKLLWSQFTKNDAVTLTSLPDACGVCRYALDGLATEPDGCRVCPECGAAWKVGKA